MKFITTTLMFVREQAGKAEEAIKLYTSVFPSSKIIDIQYYEAGEPEPEGSVKLARFTINGVEFMARDRHLHRFGGLAEYPACRDYVERATARSAFMKAHKDQIAHFAAAD